MNNYSYVTLLTDDSYIYGIIMLYGSLKKVNTKYPLTVLITDQVSKAPCEIMRQLGINYIKVPTRSISEEIYQENLKRDKYTAILWKDCLTKFEIFKLIQFDKIVFLDADIYVLKNLDHLFNYPHMTAAIDGEYFNLWSNQIHFNSGCLVIEPSIELYEDIINFANSIDFNSNLPSWIMLLADQEILNLYYKDWGNQKELHLNKYYNIFSCYIKEENVEDINQNGYFLHYIGPKPWLNNNPDKYYCDYFYKIGKDFIQEAVQNIDWNLVHQNCILSIYAICKNEYDNIKDWLNNFIEADYVCILDTGSTDGTWEYLQEYSKTHSNLIIDQKIIKPWRFDTARNESIKLIPQETTMYFMMDLDERIKEQGWAWTVKQAWEPCFNRGLYNYHRDVDENGQVLRTIPEYRIHSKFWYKYDNLVHEGLVNKAGEKMFYVQNCTPINIEVWHFPKKNKQTNYMELCEDAVKEVPDNWMMWLQLAIEYEIRNENDKAKETFLHIINNGQQILQPFEIARCFFGIGRYYLIHEQPQIALQYFREGRLYDSSFIDNYIGAAEYYYNHYQYDKTIELIESAFKTNSQSFWCNVYDIFSYYCYYLLGLSYYFKKDLTKALAYIEIACEKNNNENQELENAKKSLINEICNNWKE